MEASTKPSVLFVYYTYTQQALKVVDAMAAVFEERGFRIERAAIEFTDKRYADRFTRFPLRHAYLDIFGMLPAQTRRATGEIRTPDTVREGDYDLICFGSPTWWLTTCMPIRSFLKSDEARQLLKGKKFTGYVVCRRYWKNNLNTVKKLGTQHGGQYVDGTHFKYLGGQVRSLLSLISYLGSGEYKESYLGIGIPPTNLQDSQLDDARAFASKLADGLGTTTATASASAAQGSNPA